MKVNWAIVASAAILAGCGGGDEQRGGVTAEEAQALDNAAEMLDASPDSLVPSEEVPIGNGEAPVAAGGGDSSMANEATSNAQ